MTWPTSMLSKRCRPSSSNAHGRSLALVAELHVAQSCRHVAERASSANVEGEHHDQGSWPVPALKCPTDFRDFTLMLLKVAVMLPSVFRVGGMSPVRSA
jgi:hypothetical protein